RRALHGLGLEHRASHRPVADPRALAGARDRAPPEPRAPRAAYHHRAPGHPVDGLAGDGGDGVADDVRGQVRGHQQSRAAARNPRRLLRLVLVPLVSLIAVVLVDVWHNTPFMMLVLLAGLQSIPTELYEAARADGASGWQRFWSITLPLLKFTMAVGVMIRLIDLTKLFGLIFVLTYGGPGGSTETVAFTTYLMGFKDFRMSYAAALSYVIV